MNDTSTNIAKLNALVSEIVDLRHAASLIGWDEHVSMYLESKYGELYGVSPAVT